jgi:hypothetical protein
MLHGFEKNVDQVSGIRQEKERNKERGKEALKRPFIECFESNLLDWGRFSYICYNRL